jgi:hypothetical protein
MFSSLNLGGEVRAAITIVPTGTAIVPRVVLLSGAAALSFGNQLVGTPSAAQTVTLSNTGGSSFSVIGLSLGGPQARDFQTAGYCSGSLAPGAHCRALVTFTPTAVGVRTATLLVNDSAAGLLQSVTLNGTGLPLHAESVRDAAR